MQIRWVVILQGMNDWDMVANDYLVDQLNAVGIMPVMRLVSEVGMGLSTGGKMPILLSLEVGLGEDQVLESPHVAESVEVQATEISACAIEP